MIPGANFARIFAVVLALASGSAARRDNAKPESARARDPEGQCGLVLSSAAPVGARPDEHASPSAAIAAADSPGGRALVGQIGGETQRLRPAAQLVDAWARFAPRDATTWAATLPASEQRAQILAHAATIWAASEPAEAARFTALLSPGADREQALAQVFQIWCSRDLHAAGEWLARFDFASDSDAPLAVIATHPRLVLEMPRAALAWAEVIASPVARFGTIKAIVEEWSQRDDAAARAYVRSAPTLTSEQRQNLLGTLDHFARLGQ